MERKLKIGTAYHGNRILRHVEEDMTDIANHHMNLVVHMFTHNDMDRHRSVLKDIIAVSEEKGLEVWIDNWGIDDGPGDKAYITSLIPEAAQEYADGTRYFRPCFNHPSFRDFTKKWIDCVAEAGGKTIFWDEPHLSMSATHGFACHCATCRALFREKYGHEMPAVVTPEVEAFRTDTLIDYFTFATDYAHECGIVNTGCIMFKPSQGICLDSIDRLLAIPHFDNVGCDPYWCSKCDQPQEIYDYNYTRAKRAVETAEKFGKDHNVWVQGYSFPRGREDEMIIAADAIYDAGARTILTWSFRGGEPNDYRAASPDMVWAINGEIARRLRDRYFNEMLANLRAGRKEE